MRLTSAFSQAHTPCPVCGSTDTEDFLRLEDALVFCNVFYATQAEARHAATATVQLTACLACDHIFNRYFQPEMADYAPEYENSLHFSAHFRAYAAGVAQRLTALYGLQGKQIIEIGCGRGDFLQLLCEQGKNSGFGFDPAASNAVTELEHIKIFRGRFDKHQQFLPADLIVLRHVLEHIADPLEFLSEIRQTIGERPTGLYCEVPNAEYMLSQVSLGDVIYEHCAYFTRASIQTLFQRAGFAVLDIRRGFGDQYLEVYLRANFALKQGGEQPSAAAKPGIDGRQDFRSFAHQAMQHSQRWQAKLARYQQQGEKIAYWGAGSKGVTFLNLMPVGAVQAVVDVNPYKQGKFIPGTGQPVLAPELLREINPTRVLTGNAQYRPEIQAFLDQNGIGATLEVVAAQDAV